MQNDLEALCKANTKSEVERLARQIFDVLDVDRTNSISKKELHSMMTQIVDSSVKGAELKEFTDTFMRDMDPNKDAKITF